MESGALTLYTEFYIVFALHMQKQNCYSLGTQAFPDSHTTTVEILGNKLPKYNHWII